MVVVKSTVRTLMLISVVPMPTTKHRHHIPGEPNNLSYWSLLEQLERAWLEFLEQYESADNCPQSARHPQPEKFNGCEFVIVRLPASR